MTVAITPYDPVHVTVPDKDGTRYWFGRWEALNVNDTSLRLYIAGLTPLFAYDGVVVLDEIRVVYDAQTSGPNWHQLDVYPHPSSLSGFTIGSFYSANLAAEEWFVPDIWSDLGMAIHEAWRGQSSLTDVALLSIEGNAGLTTTNDDVYIWMRGRILKGAHP